jgi:hypothetical protein
VTMTVSCASTVRTSDVLQQCDAALTEAADQLEIVKLTI